MSALKLFVSIWLVHTCKGVTFNLNGSEYERMPPLYHLDPFEPCVEQGGRYCSVDFDLVSDTPSELLTMIQEYSMNTIKHFNHTKLSYGICVSETCKHLELQTNTTTDLKETLEACLNESLWRDYKLKAKISDKATCNKINGNQIDIWEITVLDVVVALILAVILICHVVGSLREFHKDEKRGGNDNFLSCFSIRDNLKRLMARPNKDSQFQGMQAFNALRAITAVLVIGHHSCFVSIISADNSLKFEEISVIYIYVGTATFVVQTFFAMSGFLLAFNIKIYLEKHSLTWSEMTMKILKRWLRLMLPLGITLAIKLTWFRFTAYAPLWQVSIGKEIEYCKQDWWQIPLLTLYYMEKTWCMPEMWYVAADMQLFIIGIVVLVMTTGRATKCILFLLLLAALAAPALHTYFQDLDAVALITFESGRTIFTDNRTFNLAYKRTHTNAICYILGIWCGLLTYHWQKINFNSKKKLRYRLILWALIVLCFTMMLLGSLLYAEPRPPLYVRVVCSVLIIAVYGVTICFMLVSLALNFDVTTSKILGWRGWTAPARVSYSVYITHMFVVRMMAGMRTSLLHISVFNLLAVLAVCIGISYALGFVFWLLVEAPSSNILKMIFTEKDKGEIEVARKT